MPFASSTHELSDSSQSEIRPPAPEDARAIWNLVAETPALDVNSAYAYLLMCTHFAGTSVVAYRYGVLAGFVAGYRPPVRGDAIFVWQIGVRADLRGSGLGGRLLDAVCGAPACRGVRYLEATITPSNSASRRLFAGFAARRGAELRETPGFPEELFPTHDHESELLLRIGPLDRFIEGGA